MKPIPYTEKLNTKYTRTSIGKEKAEALHDSGWWKTKGYRQIAEFQLFTEELSVPFDVFHKALEKSLGRPVWTHELGLNWEGLCAEFLGHLPAPTMEDILNLIPEEKRIIVFCHPPSATETA